MFNNVLVISREKKSEDPRDGHCLHDHSPWLAVPELPILHPTGPITTKLMPEWVNPLHQWRENTHSWRTHSLPWRSLSRMPPRWKFPMKDPRPPLLVSTLKTDGKRFSVFFPTYPSVPVLSTESAHNVWRGGGYSIWDYVGLGGINWMKAKS